MEKEFFVNSGQVKTCRGNGNLRAGAIGSCVVVTGYDPETRVGGMSHVMLPGVSREFDPSVRTKYAENALQEMMQKMSDSGQEQLGCTYALLAAATFWGRITTALVRKPRSRLLTALTRWASGLWQRRWAAHSAGAALLTSPAGV
jgi:hypothetical protein